MSDSSRYNVLGLEHSMTQDGALWDPGVQGQPLPTAPCALSGDGKAGGAEVGKQGEALVASSISLTSEGQTWHLPSPRICACRGSAEHPLLGG